MVLKEKDIYEYVKNMINNIDNRYIEINAGNVHRDLGGYPGSNHRMPSCCLAMRALMIKGDIVIEEPKKGFGANFTIRYYNRT